MDPSGLWLQACGLLGLVDLLVFTPVKVKRRLWMPANMAQGKRRRAVRRCHGPNSPISVNTESNSMLWVVRKQSMSDFFDNLCPVCALMCRHSWQDKPDAQSWKQIIWHLTMTQIWKEIEEDDWQSSLNPPCSSMQLVILCVGSSNTFSRFWCVRYVIFWFWSQSLGKQKRREHCKLTREKACKQGLPILPFPGPGLPGRCGSMLQ